MGEGKYVIKDLGVYAKSAGYQLKKNAKAQNYGRELIDVVGFGSEGGLRLEDMKSVGDGVLKITDNVVH